MFIQLTNIWETAYHKVIKKKCGDDGIIKYLIEVDPKTNRQMWVYHSDAKILSKQEIVKLRLKGEL